MCHTCPMNETSAHNAIQTRTNTHRLLGAGTVCNPTKLPKGELFTTGPEFKQVNGEWVRTGLVQVVCNKCNKVNPYGK